MHGNIERSYNTAAPFNELQRSVSTKTAAWRPGDPGTFMKLYLRPGAYLGVHFYIFELYTKFRVAWYQKHEFCKFIEMVGFLIAGHIYILGGSTNVYTNTQTRL